METKNLIMLIDDNELDTFINQKVLEISGIDANYIVCKTAEEGLIYLKKNIHNPGMIPQFIFLDIGMPVLDGYDFIKVYENFPPEIKSKSRIIIITSSDKEEDLARIKEFPVISGYLIKPLDPSALKKIVS